MKLYRDRPTSARSRRAIQSLLRTPRPMQFKPLLFVVAFAGCGSNERLPRHADSSPVSRSGPNEAHSGPLTGDTLELASVGGRALSDWRQAQSPCVSMVYAFERIVFTTDSTYSGVSARLPGCRDERLTSSDTAEWGSLFRLHGDTLTLYTGDGDEVFQSYNGQVFADSVVQVAIGSEGNRRYRRRRVTHR
jgi:hypothetical protein